MTHRGKSMYDTIQDRTRTANKKTNDLARQMLTTRQQISSLETDRLSIYEQLAVHHWNEVIRNSANESLSAVHKTAATAISVANANVESLKQLAKQRRDDLVVTSSKLNEAYGDLEQSSSTAKVRARELEAEFEARPEVIEIKQRLKTLSSTSFHNKAKVAEAHRERETKEAPYLEDPYFSYLHKRNYGTENYKAFAPMRLLDGWVARVCDYEKALENFNLLQRLEEFLITAQKSSEEEVQTLDRKLKSMYKSFVDTSDLSQLTLKESAADMKVKKLEKALSNQKQELRNAEKELEDYATGKDRQTQLARKKMAELLSKTDLASLEALAKKTPNKEDDRLVSQLNDIIRSLLKHEQNLVSIDKEYREAKRESDRLDQLESDFARKRYNRSDARFKSSFDLDDFLIGYVAGSVDFSSLSRYHVSETSSYGSSSYGSRGYSSYDSDSYSSSSSSSNSSSSISDLFSSGGSFGGDGGGFGSGGDF